MQEPGRYHAHVARGIRNNAKSGNPQMVVEFTIGHVLGPDGQWQPIPAIQRSLYLSLTDAALEYTILKLAKLEFSGDFANPEFGANVMPGGDGVVLSCSRGAKNDGSPREDWELEGWGDGGGAFNTEKTAADVELDRRFTQRWKNANAGAKAPPATKPSSPPPMPGADDGPVSTRDEAWAELQRVHGDKLAADELTGLWNTLVRKHGGGVAEANMTPTQWAEVKDEASIPF